MRLKMITQFSFFFKLTLETLLFRLRAQECETYRRYLLYDHLNHTHGARSKQKGGRP